jgi:hypothetical protein
MEVLIPAIHEWFAEKREHLAIFADSDCRLEGWFKGELLVLFTRLRRSGAITEFEREANIASGVPGKRIQVDFRVRIGTETHLCELKALCISQAAGTPRNLNFHFRDDHVGIIKDFKKLDAIAGTNKWLMAFVYPVPDRLVWERAVDSLPASLRHWRSLNRPTDMVAPLFLSLWRFKGIVA